MDCLGPYEPVNQSHPRAELQLDSPADGFLGLREWKLITRLGRVELASAYQDASWSPTGKYPAECPKAHRAGRLTCSCGFHALLPTFSSAQELVQEVFSGSPMRIVGATRAWGRLTLEPDQFRSEYASVEAIFVPSGPDAIYRSIAEQVAERYSAELVEFREAEDVLSWLGESEGAIDPPELERVLSSQPVRMRSLGAGDLPWISENAFPEGLWPEQVELPGSPDDVIWPTAGNPLGVFPVAGMIYHRGREPERSDRFKPSCPVSLVHEPGNPYDSNAIAVLDARKEEQLGYLPRNIAGDISPQQLRDRRAFVLCTWREASNSEKPFAAHILLVPAELADRLDFDPAPGSTE